MARQLLDFQYGRVVAVNGGAQTPDRRASPTIGVKSYLDGSSLTIPMSAAAWDQCMPLVGYKVFYVRFGRHQSRVLKIWGNDEEFTRKGRFGLNAGEVFIQSPSGLAYLKLDQDGRVQLVSGDVTSAMTFDDDGCTIKSSQVQLQITKNSVIELLEDGSILVERRDQDGNVLASVGLDTKNNVTIQAKENVTIKAKNIFLDGAVFAGSGASDPNQRALFGDVVTGGPQGTHPTDFSTGAPILGSAKVKASGLGA